MRNIVLFMMLYKNQCKLMNFKHDMDQQRPLQRSDLMMIRILLKIMRGEKDEEKSVEVLPEQSWFNELVDANKRPEEHQLQMGSTVMFGKCMKKFLNKDKITKVDLEGPAFELSKKRFRNNMELEYNLEQSHDVYSKLKIISLKRITVEKKYGYRMSPSELSYTTLSHPRGVVYEGIDNQKLLMRADEIHKFSDGTLNKVYNKLDVMLRDNRFGFGNEGMTNLKWTSKDIDRKKSILEKIEKKLKERRRFRRLESFVRGRKIETDYKLLVRIE
ncbi:hypothetical protein Tco_0265390 [Tanacetum coccineum]